MPLDRTKPFGTVCGAADYAYEQDGKQFDRAGNEVGGKAAKVKAEAPTPEPASEPDQVAAQLNG